MNMQTMWCSGSVHKIMNTDSRYEAKIQSMVWEGQDKAITYRPMYKCVDYVISEVHNQANQWINTLRLMLKQYHKVYMHKEWESHKMACCVDNSTKELPANESFYIKSV